MVLIKFFLYPSHLYQANIIKYSMWIILRNDCEKSKQGIGKNHKMWIQKWKWLELIKSPTHSVMNAYVSETSNKFNIIYLRRWESICILERFIFTINVSKLKCYLSMGNSLRWIIWRIHLGGVISIIKYILLNL